MLRPLFLAFTALLFSAGSASGTTFSFDCISGNGNSSKCGVGEEQLSVVVSGDSHQVSFTFRNDGDEQLSAASLYFDDAEGILASLESVAGSSGVDFQEGGSPRNLPGGKKQDFEADFHASAESPAPKNGVNPGEEVTVTFELAEGKTLADVVAALEESDLRIGVKTVAFGKSFINDPQGVPEPDALALLALGAGGLALRRGRNPERP